MRHVLNGKLIDFDMYFRKHIVANEVIWVNDLDCFIDSDVNKLRKNLFTTLSSNTIPITPTCSCGNLKAGYLKGVECQICGSQVDSRYGDFKPYLWLRRMDGVEKFLSPYFVSLLDHVTGDKNRRIVRWFGDARYNPVFTTRGNNGDEEFYAALKELPGFHRSYNYLVQNMETVLITLLKTKNYQKAKSAQLQFIIELWRREKKTICSDIVPIIHKSLIVVEKTTKGSYIQASRGDIGNAVETFARSVRSERLSSRDRATALTVQLLSDMYTRITSDFLSGKEKLVRKNLMGSRFHFTFRQVITPILGKHKYDDCHIPWQSFISAFRPHIFNKLSNRGYTHKTITKMLYRALLRFDQEIYEIANELIEESNGGIPLMIHRNPSQNAASMLKIRGTKIKTNPEDTTISMSILVWVFANGDIDGDEGNVTMLLDNKMSDMLDCLTPDKDVLDASDSPATLFGKVAIPETASATLTYRIEHERKTMLKH